MLLWHTLTKVPGSGAFSSLQVGNGAGERGMSVQVHPYFSGMSWTAPLLCADSYLLTAATHSFLVINGKIPIVQSIKGFLHSLPAWE